MIYVRKIGQKERYLMQDNDCIGYECFVPGRYQHRGATMKGSRSSGESLICMRSAYRGCPMEPVYSKELAKERKEAGWRVVS